MALVLALDVQMMHLTVQKEAIATLPLVLVRAMSQVAVVSVNNPVLSK